EQLAAQREDRLEPPVAALFRGTARGIALDDVDLAPGRVPLLAVRELARQGHPIERALADHEVARLARRVARPRGHEALLDDPAPVGGVLLEMLGDRLGDRALDLARHLGVAELG